MLWFDPSQQLSIHVAAHSLSHSERGERLRRTKERKFWGRVKDGEGKRKKIHPSCCNDNQSPLPRAAWCQPVSKQWPPWQKNTPSFIAEPHVTWNGIARWPVQISFPGCVASSCPPPASSLRGRLSNGESLTLYRHCSAIARTVVCDQHCFSPKSGMQHHKGCYQES